MQQITPIQVSGTSVLILEGKQAILERSAVLEDFARHCMRPGAFRWLEFVLEKDWRWKRVLLVLVVAPQPETSL